jgi:hypothetical protein
MLYVDQPIGAGFSYGTQSVNSTATAAPYVWIFLQAFFSLFPRYESREFGLFTESYGGHYGPGKVDCNALGFLLTWSLHTEFSYYFETQNSLIRTGHLRGKCIDLIALGINNG